MNVSSRVTNARMYAKRDLVFTAFNNPVGLSANLIASQHASCRAVDALLCYFSYPVFSSIQFPTRCLLVFRLIFIKMSF